jgi:hypothetical protein
MEAEVASVQAAFEGVAEEIETVVIRPKKTAIQVKSLVYLRE